MYLLETWYGRGIGLAVLNRCFIYAREAGFTSVWLTVWEHSTRALTLYQKAGFKVIGNEDFVLGQDVQHDYIMEKIL